MATEDPPPVKILYPHWQNEYAAARLETNPEKLPARVEAAETAIYKRLQQISQTPDQFAERRAIEEAINGLRVLKRDRLKYPDWDK